MGLPPISHELFIEKRDNLIKTTITNNSTSFSLLDQSETQTLMSNNILKCGLCNKHYKSKNALETHQGSKQHKLNLEQLTSESTQSAVDSNIETLSDINSSNIHSLSNDNSNIVKQFNKPKEGKREWKLH